MSIVCEAFVGNVILKLYEGVGSVMIRKIKGGMMTDLRTQDWCTARQAGTEKNSEVI